MQERGILHTCLKHSRWFQNLGRQWPLSTHKRKQTVFYLALPLSTSQVGDYRLMIYSLHMPLLNMHNYSSVMTIQGIKLILCDGFIRKLKSSPATHHFLCLVKEAKSKGITATHMETLSSTTCTDTTFRVEFNNSFTL